MIKRFLSIVTVILMTSFFLVSCTNNNFDLSKINIIAEDQVGVVAGTYTIDYTIEELSDLVKEHGAVVTISVSNKSDEDVPISGNTFIVEVDEVYSVTIVLVAEGQQIVKTITIYAITSTPMITITYELNGGTGYPESEAIVCETVPDLTVTPVKDDYTFAGWYIDSFLTQIYTGYDLTDDTTLYAKWNMNAVVVENPVNVTYNLNGAFQSEPIQETIELGSHPNGLEITPIYEGYVFAGWSTNQSTIKPAVLDEITVFEDITLYAVWHYDFIVLDGTDYFEEFFAEEDSTITDGAVEQLFLLNSILDVGKAEDDFNINGARVEYGLLYTEKDIDINYYDYVSNKIEGSLNLNEYKNASLIPFEIHTLPLLSDTSYNAVFYMRFDAYLLVSDVYSFTSYVTVNSGSVVGADNVLSGGYYAYDTGSFSFRPSTFITILDGYSARLDHISYDSYSKIYRKGIRTLITKDLSTGKEYLHVFNLDFQAPEVSVSYCSFDQENEDIKPTFRIMYPFEDYITYNISKCGVLYSYHHPFLKPDLYQVHKANATLDSSNYYLTTNSDIIGNGNDIYVRAYVIINGKMSYSNTVTKFVFVNSEYVVSDTFYIDINKPLPEYGYSYSYGSTNMKLWTITDSQLSSELVYNNIEITAEGQYFVTNEGMTSSSYLIDVLIIDDIPMISGVEENGVYDHPVDVAFMMYNPEWYFELDGGEYVYLPQQIQLTETGYYTIFYRTAYGIEEVHFQIVEKTE